MAIVSWLYTFFGVKGSGPYYGFWSGAGSDISELAIVIALVRLFNCNEKGCWRAGHHHTGDVVCHKHHAQAEKRAYDIANPATEDQGHPIEWNGPG